jgi:Uma2 family endonuclease
MIVVEIASPTTRLTDVNDKVELYSRIASIGHDLVIEQDQHRVIDHGRGPSGGVEPRILREGDMIMEPPGIPLALADLYRDTTLGNAAPQLADR